eukprot:scaffold274003_cov14-Tisochrysis_lutea.AAC.2
MAACIDRKTSFLSPRLHLTVPTSKPLISCALGAVTLSIELIHCHVTGPWSSARRVTARRRSPDKILGRGGEKMPSIGGRRQERSLHTLHLNKSKEREVSRLKRKRTAIGASLGQYLTCLAGCSSTNCS